MYRKSGMMKNNMLGKPLVTVIIPVYNCEKYILKCLKTVVNQTYRNLEIIIINDGSTDGSQAIIEKFGENDARIKIITQVNSGVSVARNKGVKESSGKYITFIDGDDYVDIQYIEHFVNCAEEVDADLCVCGYTLVNSMGKELCSTIPRKPYVKNKHEEYPYRILATLSRFYKRELWEIYDIKYDENKNIRGEDIPIALLSNAVAKNIQCIQQRGYYYVQHSKSARNNMRGLGRYKLPYEALQETIIYIFNREDTNSKDFFQLGIFRVFVTFLFDLVRGARKDRFDELYQFEMTMIEEYLHDYSNNKKLYLFSDLDIPFGQKLAVKFYLCLLENGLLYKMANVIRKLR